MAHSDALIFLTNITWVFVLFLFVYFFFVLFFLPTLYKKFRMRSLVKVVNSLGGVLALRNVLVSLTFFVDYFRGLSVVSVNFIRLGSFFFVFKNYFGFVVGIGVLTYDSLVRALVGFKLTGFVVDFFNDGSFQYVRVKRID